MKTCITCKFYVIPNPPILPAYYKLTERFASCQSPNRPLSPVTGEPTVRNGSCDTQRSTAADGFCGPDGKWWEAKEAEIADA